MCLSYGLCKQGHVLQFSVLQQKQIFFKQMSLSIVFSRSAAVEKSQDKKIY